MASDPWADYLQGVSEHLRLTRRAVEQGSAAPAPPLGPTCPLPDEHADRARRLAVACDQLALEVTTRLADLGPHLPGPGAGTRPRPRPRPRFVDRSA